MLDFSISSGKIVNMCRDCEQHRKQREHLTPEEVIVFGAFDGANALLEQGDNPEAVKKTYMAATSVIPKDNTKPD